MLNVDIIILLQLPKKVIFTLGDMGMVADQDKAMMKKKE